MDGEDLAAGIGAEILVTLRDGDWNEAFPGAEIEGACAARLALLRGADAALASGAPVIVDLTLTDDCEQRRLNREYRGEDTPTNVLAFPTGDPSVPTIAGAPHVLGDVVLALSTIRREAGEQRKPIADHVRHLVVHGVLHLLGYDHEHPSDAAAMEAREIAILAELGVPDPYRDTMC